MIAAEGVTSGARLPGVSSSKDPAPGSCMNDFQCGADKECNLINVTGHCYCSGGNDICSQYGRCQDTQCKVCNDCVSSAALLTTSARMMTNSSSIVAAVEAWCKGYFKSGDSRCNTLVSAVMATPNLGKRAAGICMNLGQCTSSLPATCQHQVSVGMATYTGALVSPLCMFRSVYDFAKVLNVACGSNCDADESHVHQWAS